jgi:hypothetical protein
MRGRRTQTIINAVSIAALFLLCQIISDSMRESAKRAQHLPKPIVRESNVTTGISIADLCEQVGIGGRVMTLGEAIGHPVKCSP